mgnify:CR=1 FL=1
MNDLIEKDISYHLNNHLSKLGNVEPAQIYRMAVEQAERAAIKAMMSYAGGNKSKAAEYLGINRLTLSTKMKQLRIEVK